MIRRMPGPGNLSSNAGPCQALLRCGALSVSPKKSDDLYDLVSDRAIAAKPLILTSNRAPKDWYPLFPNPVVAESLFDRLINTSHQVLTNKGERCCTVKDVQVQQE
jgi:DNA replication protein DnaC